MTTAASFLKLTAHPTTWAKIRTCQRAGGEDWEASTKKRICNFAMNTSRARRGLEPGARFDPEARGRAVRQMQIQEAFQAETAKRLQLGPNIAIQTWTAIGPAPLPNGSGNQAVTGRVTAVVVDPTNSNKVYLGTAQGGVWRSLDGGANWTNIFDNAFRWRSAV